MKIRINYDLIDKIKESKTGFSLKRTISKSLLATSISTALNIPLIFDGDNTLVRFVSISSGCFLMSLLYWSLDNKNFKEINTNFSINQLKQLASILRKHYVNTDYELLQKAYEYETKYSFMLDGDKIPRLKQEKYIMVPVVDRDGKKEVSLVQEHIVGTRDYELSYGSPTKSKVLRPAFNC